MRQKSNSTAVTSEKLVRDIRRATRKQYSAEEKIRIILDGLRGETPIAELCRREGIAESMYYSWEQSRRERKKIEMRFAHLNRILRLGRLRLRGPRGAQDEFVLAAIAQNLRRLATLVARPPPAQVLCIA